MPDARFEKHQPMQIRAGILRLEPGADHPLKERRQIGEERIDG